MSRTKKEEKSVSNKFKEHLDILTETKENEEVNFKDLPSELCSSFVLSYLDDVDLTKLHQFGSNQMKLILEDCIQGGKLLVVGGTLAKDQVEIVDVYYGDIKQGSLTEVSKVPFTSNWIIFGGICNNKIIVGEDKIVYMYSYKEDEWTKVQYEEEIQLKRTYAEGCSVDDAYLLCGGLLQQKVELMRIKEIENIKREDTHKNDAESDAGLLSFSMTNQNVVKQNLLSSTVCTTQLPIAISFGGHTITPVSRSEVILLGGSEWSKISGRAFLGEITDNKLNIKWTELESLRKPRVGHVAFKLNISLFVAGGSNATGHHFSSCERYDLLKQKWFKTQHALPFGLFRARASLSNDGSFAIITGGQKRNGGESKDIITFNEKDGFEILNTSLLYGRIYHAFISI